MVLKGFRHQNERKTEKPKIQKKHLTPWTYSKKRYVETSKRHNWGKFKVYRPQNPVLGVAFCVESESEVQNAEFQAPGGKNWENAPLKMCVLIRAWGYLVGLLLGSKQGLNNFWYASNKK